jgi:hypothetical protein
LLSKGPPIGSPLLFVYGATHVKSISFLLDAMSLLWARIMCDVWSSDTWIRIGRNATM